MYFITGLQKLETNELGWLDTGDSRTFGYYSDLDIAKERVIENACDIHECVYDYVLIEDIREGLYQYCDKDHRWLYKFNEETEEYEVINEPECMQNVSGFAIG
jgi:hypothetical protein